MTRGQSSSKVGEGDAGDGRIKRFLFVCLVTVFPKAPFLVYFLDRDALRRDDLLQRCQLSSPPVAEPIAIFHARHGKS